MAQILMKAIGTGADSRETSRLPREGGVEYAQNVDPNVRSDYEEQIVVTGRKMSDAEKLW